MRRLTDEQVDLVARRLAQKLGAAATASGSATVPTAPVTLPGTPPTGLPAGGYVAAPVGVVPRPVGSPVSGDGVFPSVDDCVQAATIAFHNLSEETLEKRREIIAAIRATMLREGDRLAKMAWEETGLGRY